jgi:hypothetical protein
VVTKAGLTVGWLYMVRIPDNSHHQRKVQMLDPFRLFMFPTKQSVETYCDCYCSSFLSLGAVVIVIVWLLDLQLPIQSMPLWVWIPFRWGVLDTTLCDKVSQGLVTDHLISPGTPVSSTKETCCHNITEILLKVPLSTITLTLLSFSLHRGCNDFASWP